jgi:hypothetical protein
VRDRGTLHLTQLAGYAGGHMVIPSLAETHISPLLSASFCCLQVGNPATLHLTGACFEWN